MTNNLLFKDGVQGRDPELRYVDISALSAIVQAAVNVELFTIPLYMASLYSLQGMHQINGKGNNFYQGRLWPGMAPGPVAGSPNPTNQAAFNCIFSVFVAEMLHLQLASNICTAVGVTPSYTSSALQNENHGWTCYGTKNNIVTVLPHILDFKDTIAPYNGYTVQLGPVCKDQINLFLVIEETEKRAESIISETAKGNYFPSVPFANWQNGNTEKDLPYFGSIGFMYTCLWEYLSIQYSNGKTLWDYVYQPGIAVQQDIFNTKQNGHLPEYPGIDATITGADPTQAQLQVINMIDAITDQGEGNGVVAAIKARLDQPTLLKAEQQLRTVKAAAKNKARSAGDLTVVEPIYQPNRQNLEADYPSYNDTGTQLPQSADATARSGVYGAMDHYEVFTAVLAMLAVPGKDAILTWAQWHENGNQWQPEMLLTTGHEQNTHPIPSAQDISDALNRLKQDPTGSNYQLFSQASAGAIAGVTTVLDNYWKDKTGGISFPSPSMAGSGDRMSICWAVFGEAPDLSRGNETDIHYPNVHACQSLSLEPPYTPTDCASTAIYHTCKGSNGCKAEGGCGFVQSVNGGGSCSSSGCNSKLRQLFRSDGTDSPEKGTCGQPSLVSAPGDNSCGGRGGCAVPISASQMYPAPGALGDTMELFEPDTDQGIGTMQYQEGNLVYDVAWNAYISVLRNRGVTELPEKPKPSDLRLAFPPST